MSINNKLCFNLNGQSIVNNAFLLSQDHKELTNTNDILSYSSNFDDLSSNNVNLQSCDVDNISINNLTMTNPSSSDSTPSTLEINNNNKYIDISNCNLSNLQVKNGGYELANIIYSMSNNNPYEIQNINKLTFKITNNANLDNMINRYNNLQLNEIFKINSSLYTSLNKITKNLCINDTTLKFFGSSESSITINTIISSNTNIIKNLYIVSTPKIAEYSIYKQMDNNVTVLINNFVNLLSESQNTKTMDYLLTIKNTSEINWNNVNIS